MQHLKPGGILHLEVDACSYGAGAVLVQSCDGVENPIAYFSKVFSKPERNYCVTRRELLAIILSVKYFRHLLIGKPFIIKSDHASLQWLLNFKNPENQLARWIETLADYDYVIQFHRGKDNIVADSLSRR